MPKDTTNTKTAKPAGQKDAGKGPDVPCRILINGTLYNGCHHAKNKELPIPEKDAQALAKQGAVEILPGLA